MTKPRTAILWGPDDLLAQAMETFLMKEDSWNVIRIPADECIHAFVEQAQTIRPDLLIFSQAKRSDDSDPLMKLIEAEPRLRAIADQPDLKVITVSLENNVIQVYCKHSITVRYASDLLSVIEDRYFSEHPDEKEVDIGKRE